LMGGPGGGIKFTTGEVVAGQYKLVIHYDKYANGTSTYPYEGYQNLYVNDNPNPIQKIHYIGTHDKGDVNFQDTSVTIRLERGTNTLTIKEFSPSAVASIDYISLSLVNQ